MTKIATFAAAFVLFAPIAAAILLQAAQIVSWSHQDDRNEGADLSGSAPSLCVIKKLRAHPNGAAAASQS
jgi:hypothetical protein